jgi:hypothetical protein
VHPNVHLNPSAQPPKKKEPVNRQKDRTHPIYNFAQQVAQPTDGEQDGADDVVPHKADFVQDGEDVVV